MATRAPLRRQAGISLIEMMVGLAIGMLAVLVIYQTFAVSEGVKRQTISAGDAQQTGLLASYLLGNELGNAGNGLMNNLVELTSCPDTGDITTTMRPVSVVITPGGSDDAPDSVVVNYATPKTLASGALFTASAATGDGEYKIQSPTGFHKEDMAIAVSMGGLCERVKITDVTAPDANGVVTLTLSKPSVNSYPASARIFNIGHEKSVQRVRYDVDSGILRSTDLMVAGATPAPIASSIMNLKLLYGIDTNNDGAVDTWQPATGDWAPDEVLKANATKLRQIRAIRMGLIVRSDEEDRDAPAFDWELFACTDDEKKLYTCPDPLDGTLEAKHRYRVYETVIPLRNAMWN